MARRIPCLLFQQGSWCVRLFRRGFAKTQRLKDPEPAQALNFTWTLTPGWQERFGQEPQTPNFVVKQKWKVKLADVCGYSCQNAVSKWRTELVHEVS